MADAYEQLAPYYDQLHAELTADVAFILALAEELGGPILEVGCGTGRLLLPLARAERRVTGLDRSPAMLRRAHARLQAEGAAVAERVNLLQADAVRLPLVGDRYRFLLIPYNTFLHLPPRDAVAACRALRRSAHPAGRLFLDLANPFVIDQTPSDRFLTLERSLHDEASDEIVLVLASNALDQTAQVLTITWIYDRMPAGGGAVNRSVIPIRYHYYYPHQLQLILAESGWQLEAMYGDYDGTAFDEASERLLLLARPTPS
ncbi:MAG: methyltransferase domain-containing protein [Candidatus Promineifilaceae bacterium]|nr:methyltransferase domain-containing protein [Candidatus Promineifilaceae bacterium]